MIRAILIVVGFLLYNMVLVNSTETKLKEKITRNCLGLHSYSTLYEAEKLCKDMVEGWHAHAENHD